MKYRSAVDEPDGAEDQRQLKIAFRWPKIYRSIS